MRYTKELQKNVCNDISFGLTPAQCAAKYGVPVSVVIKWNGLEMTEQRAAEIAIRKYQAEVSSTEADISSRLDEYLAPDISDEELFKIDGMISKKLFKLVADVVKKERELRPQEERKSDAQIIIEIANKWKDNKFVKMYTI